ncbi:helix-turn-helix transcriptional regulator [Kiloniella antarctica]|uniref:Helix-turn-helix transcriptional regulator n=1 Tax=Kiloniella antarctica TaxID=1550907 RepID=A0ABW5BR91_9PROT
MLVIDDVASFYVLGELEMIKSILADKIKSSFPNADCFLGKGGSIRLPYNYADIPHCILYISPMLTKQCLLKISAIQNHPLAKIILVTDERSNPDHTAQSLGVNAFYSINKSFDGLANLMASLLATGPLPMNKEHQVIEPPLLPFQLTTKENQILTLLKKGMSNKEIANITKKAEGTVKVQLKSIYKKLNIHSRAEAMNRFMDVV